MSNKNQKNTTIHGFAMDSMPPSLRVVNMAIQSSKKRSVPPSKKITKSVVNTPKPINKPK